jgi:hypothetical protein
MVAIHLPRPTFVVAAACLRPDDHRLSRDGALKVCRTSER